MASLKYDKASCLYNIIRYKTRGKTAVGKIGRGAGTGDEFGRRSLCKTEILGTGRSRD